MRTLWNPILFTDHFYFKIKVKNVLADVPFEIYVKTPNSILVNTYKSLDIKCWPEYGSLEPKHVANCVFIYIYIWRHAVAQLVGALRYKSEGYGFDSR